MSSDKLWVKMGANGPVFLPAPIQGVRQVGGEPMEVPDSRFIRRRLEVGDLVLVQSPAAPAPEPSRVDAGPANAPAAPVSKKLSKEKE